jgi:hypothetical protein
MIWVMVVAKTMCHVVRKSAVTPVMSIEVLPVSNASCRSRGFGGWRSYGSLYDEDVLLAVAICTIGGRYETACLARQGTQLRSGDLLNSAVARTHLLKMITPELQAIQTLYEDQSISPAVQVVRAEAIVVAIPSVTTSTTSTTTPKTWGSVGWNAELLYGGVTYPM